MSLKGKPKYNRAIALAKLEKAYRHLEDVYRRAHDSSLKWEFAHPSTRILIDGVLSVLGAAVVQEKTHQGVPK